MICTFLCPQMKHLKGNDYFSENYEGSTLTQEKNKSLENSITMKIKDFLKYYLNKNLRQETFSDVVL